MTRFRGRRATAVRAVLPMLLLLCLWTSVMLAEYQYLSLLFAGAAYIQRSLLSVAWGGWSRARVVWWRSYDT